MRHGTQRFLQVLDSFFPRTKSSSIVTSAQFSRTSVFSAMDRVIIARLTFGSTPSRAQRIGLSNQATLMTACLLSESNRKIKRKSCLRQESHKSLNAQEKEILRQWIRDGAEYESHWSLRPISNSLKATIDELVDQRLARKGWQRQPIADKQTLIRRLSLDLTGIPPTPEEVEVFTNDEVR